MNAQNRSHFSNTHGKIWVIEKKYSGFFRAFQVPFGKEILLLMIAFKKCAAWKKMHFRTT